MARNYSSVVEPKTLTANVGISDTQITLNNVTGLPSRPYVLVLNPDTNKEEAVLVTLDQTGVTSPTLKVQRAIEASGGVGIATTHSVGNIVKHMIVGSDLQLVHDHIDNTSAHDATGGVVGLTKTQALTNKTINLTNNTLTGTKVQFNAALSDADFTTLTGVEELTNKTLTSPAISNPTISGSITGAVVTSANIVDNTIVNADINTAAAIDWTKLAISSTVSATEIGYVDGVTSAIQTQLTNNTPVGALTMFAGSTAPTGWLLCQGGAVSRTTYASLFSLIGTTYGVGDNTTTFNLPDLRGRAPIGVGTGTGLTARALAATTGVESVTLTSAQSGIPAHGHAGSTVSISDPGHSHVQSGRAVAAATGGAPALIDPSWGSGATVTGTGTTGITATPTIANSTAANAASAHDNMQPSIAINFIIKF